MWCIDLTRAAHGNADIVSERIREIRVPFAILRNSAVIRPRLHGALSSMS
jgi:hypothetical protein